VFLQKAVDLSPKYAEAWSHLGSAYLNKGELSKASECFEKSVALKPSSPEAWNNIALVYQSLCRFDEAIDCFRQTRALAPNSPGMHSNLLFGLQYQPGKTAEDLFSETMEWGVVHAAPHYHKAKAPTNVADPDKRLRIGYLGADFKGHSSAYFLMPLFENHNREAFEIFVYAQVAPPDGWTQKFMDLSHNWHFTNAVTDDDLADLVRSERIDILVDLSAHTADTRVLTMARKPAPVQVSWIGIGNTTGVKTVDYFLTDPHYLPEDHERFFCEKPWRLPRIAYCYDPLNVFPEVGPQPALEKGFITFGCFSRSVRMNPAVLETWAKLMVGVPNSQILINTKSMLDDGLRETFHETFERHGIARERVRLEFIVPTQATWAAYNEVDIALDPFPHNAGLTSYESLWMGVPVLTLCDRPPQGRYGTSIMNNIGLPQFVAKDPEDYVRIGTEWARTPERLAELRKGLRDRMKTSPLCDGAAFARDVEDAYRGMWRRWCAEQGA
jgi:predicted O-linked N-acetylglucosamine transferase (SPINDLY family)